MGTMSKADHDGDGTSFVLQPLHRMTPLPVRVIVVPKRSVMNGIG